MKKCPNCGAQIIDESLFCTECGKPIPQVNVCPHCGESVNEGEVSCSKCGQMIKSSFPDFIEHKANFNSGLNSIGGKIVITPTQLIFRAHAFNIGNHNDRIFEIKDIVGYKKGMLTFLYVSFSNGEDIKLSVWEKDLIINQLEERRNALCSSIIRNKNPQGNACIHCGASVNEGDMFCQNCGLRVDENPTTELTEATRKKCANCGALVNNGDMFCENCGMNLADGSMPTNESSFDVSEQLTKLKKFVPYILGILLLIAIGYGSFYGYEAYSAYKTEKTAREKFVADSLEQVRKKSIRLAEQKEKERIEAEKLENFRKKFTFSNVLNMLKHPNNTAFAEKCGLSLIYKDSEKEEGYEEGQYFTYYEYAYGYDVEKGSKKDDSMGYTVNATSNHSCYFRFYSVSDVGMIFYFKNESDADYLLKIAEDYGLIMCDGNLYIPKRQSFKGYIKRDNDFDPSENALFDISRRGFENGWYVIFFNPYTL